MYIAMRFKSTEMGRAGFDRAVHILCQDPGVAVYILALIGFFIWLCIGVSWSFEKMENECIGDYGNAVSVSIGCGFSFLIVGFMALCFSICCSCCYRERQDNTLYSAPNRHNHGTNVATTNGANDIESIPVVVATPVEKAGPQKGGASAAYEAGKEPSPSAPPIEKEPSLINKSKVKYEDAKVKTSTAINDGLESMKKFLNKK
jgi:hypothetical protein